MNINQLTTSRIKEIRTEKGLTAEAVAKELDISKTAYSQLENGKVEITLNRIEKLAQIFNISVSDFIPAEVNNTQVFNGNGGESTNTNTSHTFINFFSGTEDNLNALMEVIKSAFQGKKKE